MSRKIYVMISGLPGDMAAKSVQEIAKQTDMELVKYALTGPCMPEIFESGGYTFGLVRPADRHDVLIEARKKHDGLMIVDFSKARMEDNARAYASHRIPFVYGGTFGNRDKLVEVVSASDVSAFAAPNFSRPLNIFPGTSLNYLAGQFPNGLKGYRALITESHQSTKADVSGTARAWTLLLEKLGIEVDGIESVRDPKAQKRLGVPEEFLPGHAYHSVSVASHDGNVRFGFFTQVDGRGTYAEEVPGIIRFLDGKIREGSKGEVFKMDDYLKSSYFPPIP